MYGRRSRSRSREREGKLTLKIVERRKNRISRFSDAPPPEQQHVKSSGRRNKWGEAKPEQLRQLAQVAGLDPTTINPGEAGALTVLSTLQSASVGIDSNKVRKKVYIPQNTGINYIGLLIGPKGLYQKKLEESTQCKILIRGKGSQKEGQPPQPDDHQEQHVLIIADDQHRAKTAEECIRSIIEADESTINRIREKQLKTAAKINEVSTAPLDESQMTPYGPPSPYAYILPIPNDLVGYIIGKGGEKIRELQTQSGAKIQVARKEIPNTNKRNIFIEGPPQKYEYAKKLIEEIVQEYEKRKGNILPTYIGEENPFHYEPFMLPVTVPNKMTGKIVGKGAETLKQLHYCTGAKIFVPKLPDNKDQRTVMVAGTEDQCFGAREEINYLLTGSRPEPIFSQQIDRNLPDADEVGLRALGISLEPKSKDEPTKHYPAYEKYVQQMGASTASTKSPYAKYYGFDPQSYYALNGLLPQPQQMDPTQLQSLNQEQAAMFYHYHQVTGNVANQPVYHTFYPSSYGASGVDLPNPEWSKYGYTGYINRPSNAEDSYQQ